MSGEFLDSDRQLQMKKAITVPKVETIEAQIEAEKQLESQLENVTDNQVK